MRFRVQPDDFVVEEQVRLPISREGPYALYQVRKRAVTTMQVQAAMASSLGIPPSSVLFPALKDRRSVALQHVAIRGTGPAVLQGLGYQARFVGRAKRPLERRDLQSNRFTVIVRDLDRLEATGIRGRLAQLERYGLPNYFDRQRFGSYAPGGEFPGKRILQRDEEGALRAYLSEHLIGDPRPVRRFKSFARRHWGQWDLIFQRAPRPSNFRSVLTYLRDHPTDFRRALNLVTPRLLSLWLAAYQSFLWNRIASRYIARQLEDAGVDYSELFVLEALPLYTELPEGLLQTLSSVSIPLLHHRVSFRDAGVAAEVATVLQAEGLATRDFKARVLKKAYLSAGARSLLLRPLDVVLLGEEEDDRFPGKSKLEMAFSLPPGTYATLVLETLRMTDSVSESSSSAESIAPA